jgi:hypothetical protein
MEPEVVDRIETLARQAAGVLIVLAGSKAVFGAMDAQLGPLITYVSILCMALASQAHLVRGCMPDRPRLFVAFATAALAFMTITFMTCV